MKCKDCANRMYPMAIGHCKDCGGFTSSISYALCNVCSTKKNECQVCRKDMTADKNAK